MYLPTYSTIGQTPVLQELPRVARVVLTRDARWKGGGGGRGKGRERFKGNGGFRDSESRNFLTVIFFFFSFWRRRRRRRRIVHGSTK